MRKSVRLLLGIRAFLLLIELAILGYGALSVRRCWPKTDGAIQLDGLQAEVTVVRDEWGIPHIYASSAHDLFMAQGYVHAQDRFCRWSSGDASAPDGSRRFWGNRLWEREGVSASAEATLVLTP